MPASAIIEKILSDARKEADTILTSFRKEVEALEKERDQEIEKIKTEAAKEAELRAEEVVKRELSSKQMEARKSLLEFKQELIDRIFDLAYEQVTKLKSEEYKDFLKTLFLKTVETGEEEVIIGKKDVRQITPSFLQTVNRELKKTGKEGKLRLGEPSSEIDGGFILRKGRKETDVTLSALFASARDELETEVAEILFGEEK